MVGTGAQGGRAARAALASGERRAAGAPEWHGPAPGRRDRPAGRARKVDMPFIRRQWTPKEADEWTREDTIAVIISPLVYILLMIGTALSMLAMWQGFVILAAGVILMLVMIRIINPKLSSVSEAYEKKQKGYIEELERTIKWEE
jgi:hypothetical protein